MCSSDAGNRELDLRSLQDDELSYSYSCIRSYSENRYQIEKQLIDGHIPKFKREPSKLFHESGERNNPIFSQFYYNTEKDYNMKKVNVSSSNCKQDSGNGFKMRHSSVFLKWVKCHLKCVKPFWLFSNNACTKTNIFSFFSKPEDQKNVQQKLKMEVLLNNIDKEAKLALYNYLQNLNLKVEEKMKSKNNESICEVNVSSIVNDNDTFYDLLKFFKKLDNNDSTDVKHKHSVSELHIKNKFNNSRNNFKVCTGDSIHVSVNSENKTNKFQDCRKYKPHDLGNICNNSCEEGKMYIKLPDLASDFKQNKLFDDVDAQVYSDHEVFNRKSSGDNNNSDVKNIPNSMENCLNQYRCNDKLSDIGKIMFNLCENNSTIGNKSKKLKKETVSNNKNDILFDSKNHNLLHNCFFNKNEYFVPECIFRNEDFFLKKQKESQHKICNNYFELREQICESKCANSVNENKNFKISCCEHSERHSSYRSLKYKIKDLETIKLCMQNCSDSVDQNSPVKCYVNKMMCNTYKLRALPVASKRKFLPYSKSLHSRTDSQNVTNSKLRTCKTASSKKHRKVRFTDEVTGHSDKYHTHIGSRNVRSTYEHLTQNSHACHSKSLLIDDIKQECSISSNKYKCFEQKTLSTQNVSRLTKDTDFDSVQYLINSHSSFQPKDRKKEFTLTMNCGNTQKFVKEKMLTMKCGENNICLNKLDDIADSIKNNKDIHCHQIVKESRKGSLLSLKRKYANTSIDLKCNTLTRDGSTQTPSLSGCSKQFSKFTVHKNFGSLYRLSSCNKNQSSKHMRATNKPYKLYSDNDIQLILLCRTDRLPKSECKFKSDAVHAYEGKCKRHSSHNRIVTEKCIESDDTFVNIDCVDWENKLCSTAVEPEEKNCIFPTKKTSDFCSKLQSSVSSLQSYKRKYKVINETSRNDEIETDSLTTALNNFIILNNSALPVATEISESQKYLNKEHQVDKVCQTNFDTLTSINKKPTSSDITSSVSSTKTINEYVASRTHFKLPVTGCMEQNINTSDSTGNALVKILLKNGKGKLEVPERSISIEDCIKQIFSNLQKENNDVNAEILELIKLKVIDNLSDEILNKCRALISMKDILFYCVQELDNVGEETQGISC